ncbi:hypothetical protein KCP76_04410 [Salmonella enterica subsp. enterica serovar Weltevreden]|nr:hypothetical protein KCP76_04410 [Salmonella enterica subsp. enterica serovar Weltevreden]
MVFPAPADKPAGEITSEGFHRCSPRQRDRFRRTRRFNARWCVPRAEDKPARS